MDYRWWVFIHIVGVAAFLISHGVSAWMGIRLRRERDRDRIRELISFSGTTTVVMYVSLVVLLIGGLGGALQVFSLKQTWLWLSLVILIATGGSMAAILSPYYRRVTEAIAVRPSGVPRTSDEELADLLTSARPMIGMLIGVVALLAIIWMMIFKPGLG